MHHHQHTHTPSTAAARPPFPPYGYPYAHMGYPGIPPPPPPPPPASVASSPSAKQSPDRDGDSVDAYEAAQTILKAINFRNLLQLPAEDPEDGLAADGHQAQQSGLETLLSHVQAALASSAADASAAGPLAVPAPVGVMPAPSALPINIESAADPRAELQAQIALLAAQLVELSQAEEAVPIVQDMPPAPLPLPISVSTHDPPPQNPPATPAIPDINPSETQVDDNDDSDDDDMEEII